jgi:SAM-dependent methyltransferase
MTATNRRSIGRPVPAALALAVLVAIATSLPDRHGDNRWRDAVPVTYDPALARGFGGVAGDYDRLRPTPPDAAVDWLLPAGAADVLDLGAGTGAMTRQLERRAGRVLAVDPDERMLEVLRRRSPGVEALTGSAESIPLPDASVDAVVVSSAWHWVDVDRAAPEIARVLRDGGRLAVVWNHRESHDSPLRDVMSELLPPEEVALEERRHLARRLELPPGSPFGTVEAAALPFTRGMSPDEVAEAAGTYAAVIARGEQGRAAAVELGRRMLRERHAADAVLTVPFVARCYRADRLPRA